MVNYRPKFVALTLGLMGKCRLVNLDETNRHDLWLLWNRWSDEMLECDCFNKVLVPYIRLRSELFVNIINRRVGSHCFSEWMARTLNCIIDRFFQRNLYIYIHIDCHWREIVIVKKSFVNWASRWGSSSFTAQTSSKSAVVFQSMISRISSTDSFHTLIIIQQQQQQQRKRAAK